jgi:hypothetical protein
LTITEYSNEWFEFDTAATVHTTNRKDLLANPSPTTIKIKGHDRTKTKTELIGSAYIKYRGQKIELQEVHYHPNFSNLVGGLVWSPPYSLQDDGDLRTFWWENNLVFEFKPCTFSKKQLIRPDEDVNATRIDLEDLHERYEHTSLNTLILLPEAQKIRGGKHFVCEACEKGKSSKSPAYKQAQSIWTKRTLQRIHPDLVGPFQIEPRGHRYILDVMDDFSQYCTAIPLKNKVGSEVATALMKFIEQLETMTKQKVSQIQADWGGESRNKDTQKAYESKGIILKETIPYHNETNAAIERAI